jgi:flagellar biosynthetic protein FlhB
MSEQPDQDSKTEPATPRRIQQKREEGEVAISKDVMALASILASVMSFVIVGAYSVEVMDELWHFVTQRIAFPHGARLDENLFLEIMIAFVKILSVPLAAITVVVVLAGVAQTKLNFAAKALTPKPEKLNPLPGLKRMFLSANTLMELAKSILKLSVLAVLSWWVLAGEVSWLARMHHIDLEASLGISAGILMRLFFSLCCALIFFAVLDYIWQKHQYDKKLKMTIKEVKDDFKENEGDPFLKGQRRQRQRQMALSRGQIQAAANASVVVVNPTHVAVALRYTPGDPAPVVLCKGKEKVAARIRAVARENGVPIVQRRSLARLLYKTASVGQRIPTDVFEAVAEVLALVMRMRGSRE